MSINGSKSVWRRRASVCFAVALGAVGALTVATPAFAGVPGLVRVSNSITGTADFQSVTATCAAGQVLVGAGFQITGGTGEVIVDDFVPTVGPTGSVFVGAYLADPPYAPVLSWTLTAYANCADPIPGIVRVTATSANNSVDKSITATCPAGTAPVGTGYQVNGATGEVAVGILRPTATGVQVTAYEEDPVATNWTVSAFAICATPLAGLLQVSATGPAGTSPDLQSVPGTCPAGRVLLGLGFQVGGTGEMVVDDFIPLAVAGGAPASMSLVAYDADPDYVPNWTLTAYGICATA